MASVILYCKRPECGKGYASVGDLPVHCPACGHETKWTTSPPYKPPVKGWAPTVNDRRFLRSGRIDPE